MLALGATGLIAAAALTGCGSTVAASSSSSSSTPSIDLTGPWQLRAGQVGGVQLDLARGRPITFAVEDNTVSGSSACNSYGGTASFDGATVRFRQLGGTDMACEPAVMELEQSYLQALGAVDSAARDGADLVLSGPAVNLTFSVVPPVEDKPLANTLWTLDTVLQGEVASSVAVASPLQLAPDGTMNGSTGCGDFTGTYVLTGTSLRLTITDRTTTPCPNTRSAQVAAVSDALGEELVVQIEGDRLTLTAPDGSGLEYRAAAAGS